MVLKEIWAEAKLTYRQNVCIPCLEDRLGRKLTPADFTHAPCNEIIHMVKPFRYRLDNEGPFNIVGQPGVKGFLAFYADLATTRI